MNPVRAASTEAIVAFLDDIGLPVRFTDITEPTFVPGIRIEGGQLTVDETRMLYPGDLLHEAGHLALLPAGQRAAITGDVGGDGGFEMGAIAWSYAAALHLRIDPAIVFHPEGYRGASQSLLESFGAGSYIGLPILQWLGLAARPAKVDAAGAAPYPRMLKWVLD
jgi:hypothetical protein